MNRGVEKERGEGRNIGGKSESARAFMAIQPTQQGSQVGVHETVVNKSIEKDKFRAVFIRREIRLL